MEDHKYSCKLQVALEQYMHFRCRLRYCWNHCLNGKDMGFDAVQEGMEVEYYHAGLQDHHLAVVYLICIQSILCDCDGGE